MPLDPPFSRKVKGLFLGTRLSVSPHRQRRFFAVRTIVGTVRIERLGWTAAPAPRDRPGRTVAPASWVTQAFCASDVSCEHRIGFIGDLTKAGRQAPRNYQGRSRRALGVGGRWPDRPGIPDRPQGASRVVVSSSPHCGCYVLLTRAEDRALVGTDPSAGPGAKTGGGAASAAPFSCASQIGRAHV